MVNLALDLRLILLGLKINKFQKISSFTGTPVKILKDQEALVKSKFLLQNYNLVASDLVSFNRSLPDVRYSECKTLNYPKKLPKTSIIIIFHNEAWSTLIRTLWSIIYHSPVELLQEIVLVDDNSTYEYLGKTLDDYVALMPIQVTVIRSKERIGLIRARVLGAKHATVKFFFLSVLVNLTFLLNFQTIILIVK